jgi:hypothetical protein
MQKLTMLAVAITIVAAASLAITETQQATSADHVSISLPSIQHMMSDAKDLPEQSFDAY